MGKNERIWVQPRLRRIHLPYLVLPLLRGHPPHCPLSVVTLVNVFIYTMNVTLKLRRSVFAPALRRSGGLLRAQLRTPQWRPYSTAPADDTLPLKGVRVLDMTRVLAGVSCPAEDYN